MNYETKTLPSGIVIKNVIAHNYKYWWVIKNTGILHNEGEPAFEDKNGTKHWCQHNKLHRLDGPALEEVDGHKGYYIDHKEYLEDDYWNHPRVKEYLYIKEHPELKAFV